MKERDELWRATGYVPSSEQLAAHDDSSRFKIIAGGVRAGKSYSAAKELLWQIFRYAAMHSEGGETRRYVGGRGVWWIVGPTYELCRPEFGYLKDDLLELGLVKRRGVGFPRVGQCVIRMQFGTVETKSADEAVKLAGVAPDGILVCEAAQLDYYAFLKLIERSSQKRAWIWASGSFEGSLGWYPTYWQRWQGENPEGGKSFSIPTWSNLAVFPGGRDDPEIQLQERSMPSEMFQERFGAKPCPPRTLVFSEFDHTRHVVRMRIKRKYREIVDDNGNLVEVHLPEDYPVEIAIDPGYAGAYAVNALMKIGDRVYHFDEIYMQRSSARDVIAEVRARRWWPRVQLGVIDIAGRQHHEGRSHEEIWRAEAGIPIVSKPVGVIDGIERHRTFLAAGPDRKPRLYHSSECAKTIWEYENYRYREQKEGRPARELPIDANNHSLKAIAYWLVWHYGFVKHERVRRIYESPFSDWTDRNMIQQPEWLPEQLR